MRTCGSVCECVHECRCPQKLESLELQLQGNVSCPMWLRAELTSTARVVCTLKCWVVTSSWLSWEGSVCGQLALLLLDLGSITTGKSSEELLTVAWCPGPNLQWPLSSPHVLKARPPSSSATSCSPSLQHISLWDRLRSKIITNNGSLFCF